MDKFRQMLKGRAKGVYMYVYEMDKFRQMLRGKQRVYTYVYEMDKFRQMLRGKQRVFVCLQSCPNPNPPPAL